jgi:hypothetical protein
MVYPTFLISSRFVLGLLLVFFSLLQYLTSTINTLVGNVSNDSKTSIMTLSISRIC